MSLDYGMPIVLPPIGPLFASSGGVSSPSALLAYESEEQREQYEEDMARYFGVPLPSCIRRKPALDEEPVNLRTPTSVQPAGGFPSSSPVKKDSAKSHAKTALPLLQLDSPTQTDGSNETEHSSEEEKLRVSRERNRLHAQRTRIRKRELLESLKERIEALQDEYELLKQAYDFHATAVCLLRLGNVVDVPCVQKLEQVGVNSTEDRDEDGQLAEAKATGHDSDVDEHDDVHEHEKSCACSTKDDAVCTCVGVQLNANGKRPHAAASSSSMLVCSKEERERVRRERNRLHARRARLRKKLVLEKSQQVSRTWSGWAFVGTRLLTVCCTPAGCTRLARAQRPSSQSPERLGVVHLRLRSLPRRPRRHVLISTRRRTPAITLKRAMWTVGFSTLASARGFCCGTRPRAALVALSISYVSIYGPALDRLGLLQCKYSSIALHFLESFVLGDGVKCRQLCWTC
jgi:hypothetical protein